MITPTELDVELLLALNGDGGSILDFIMYWASARLTWVPLYALLLWAVWKKVGWKGILWFVVAVTILILLADQTANFFKHNFPKLRPSHYEPLEGLIHTGVYGYVGGGFSTVSAHAANTMAAMMLCGSVIRKRWVWIGLGVWVALVSYSRIYLGVHYPFDVALGLIEGFIWGYIIARLYNKLVLPRLHRK